MNYACIYHAMTLGRGFGERKRTMGKRWFQFQIYLLILTQNRGWMGKFSWKQWGESGRWLCLVSTFIPVGPTLDLSEALMLCGWNSGKPGCSHSVFYWQASELSMVFITLQTYRALKRRDLCNIVVLLFWSLKEEKSYILPTPTPTSPGSLSHWHKEGHLIHSARGLPDDCHQPQHLGLILDCR